MIEFSLYLSIINQNYLTNEENRGSPVAGNIYNCASNR